MYIYVYVYTYIYVYQYKHIFGSNFFPCQARMRSHSSERIAQERKAIESQKVALQRLYVLYLYT